MHARYLAAEHLGQEVAFTTRSGYRARGLIELLAHAPKEVRVKLSTELISLYLNHDDIVAGAVPTNPEVVRASQLNGSHLEQMLVFSHGTRRIHGVLDSIEVSGRELNSKNILLVRELNSKNILLVYKTKGR